MKRPLLILILLLMLGLLAYQQMSVATKAAAPAASAPVLASSAASPATLEPVAKTKSDVAIPKAPLNADGDAGPRFKRAYMLSLEKGLLGLLESQDVEGDFSPQRRKPEEWSGMLRCRLLSENNTVLAEELLPAPDQLCAVIDPKSGSDKPVQYTVAGPVVFQVRMPRVKGATRLDIFRIIQPTEPVLEGLIGSIPLPRS